MRAVTRSLERRLPQTRGFTLIEVVVGVAIVALMGTMVLGALTTTTRAKAVAESEAAHYRMLRGALSRMARELSAAYVSDRYDAAEVRNPQDRPSNFIGERDRLLFTSFAHRRLYSDAKEGDSMVVEYLVDRAEAPGERDRRDLYRRIKPRVLGEMDEGGSREVLFEGIERLELAYWDPEREDWDDEWDTSRTERQGLLPTRVRIRIVTEDEEGDERVYSTQARIFLDRELPR